MKSVFTKIFSGLALAMSMAFIFPTASVAQDFSGIIQANTADAELLAKNYMSPFFVGFGNGLANGWYNTAAPHKFPGFDLTVTANLVYIPTEDQSFTFNASEYSSITGVRSGGGAFQTSGEVETIFGAGESESELQLNYSRDYQGQTYDVNSTVQLPSGSGFAFLPVPVAQLGIGLPKGTDLKVRFIPTIALDDASFKLFGVGVMHDFKQWIPGLKVVPFDASVFIGYTKFSAEYDFSNSGISDDGLGLIDVSALTYQLLVSKKLAILTVYAGFGANSIKSNLKMSGTYDIEATASNGSAASIPLVDPVDISLSQGGGRATFGMRLKLAILTLHADYTLQKYNTLSAGVGFSVR